MQSPPGGKKRRAISSPAPEITAKKPKISEGADGASQPVCDSEMDGNVAKEQSRSVELIATKKDTRDPALAETVKKGKGKAKLAIEGECEPRMAKNPPVKSCFVPWKPNIAIPPKSAFWGVKPKTGDPRPHPDQPSARESNGATNPPMWENRKFRFVCGQRYVKHFGPIEPPNAESLPDLDQEDLLAIQLIDMRDGGKKNPGPRRQPVVYFYEHGKPKDWNNRQAVKALNDRRGQSIDRITVDDPWKGAEQDYLAALLVEYPNASIWELTERHNDRFMGVDFTGATAFEFSEISTGRTVESVRHEYVMFKAVYDRGETPAGVRWRTEKSKEGRALHAAKKMEELFGLPDKKLEKAYDEENEVTDGEVETEDGTPKKKPVKKAKTPTKKATTKKATPKKTINTVDDSEDMSDHRNVPHTPLPKHPKLDELDEELLEIAGAYHPSQVRHSPPLYIPPRSKLGFTDSPLTDLGDWSPITPEEEERLAEKSREQAVKDTVIELVNAAVDHAVFVGLGIELGIDTDVEAADQTKVSEQQDAVINHSHATTETTLEDIETHVQVEIFAQEVHMATSEPTVAEDVAPLRAVRHVSFDENYDDDEGFDSA